MSPKKLIGATLVVAGLLLLTIWAIGTVYNTFGSLHIGNPALTP